MPDETLIPAGPDWCAKWPTSISLEDLISPFRENCKAFIAALEAQGATVSISATYRPAERAYLMNHCCLIAQGKEDPASVPPMTGVSIQWDLGDPQITRDACSAMMRGYQIVYPAALVSRHTQRLAVDMTIHNAPVQGQALWDMGKSFGVIKLLTDPPHWSDDGH